VNETVKIVSYGLEVTRIGVIADTHLPTRARTIPSKIFELFAEVQLILHAGDLVDQSVIDELGVIAPVEAVAGNMDPLHLDHKLGRVKLIRIGPLSIGMLHGDIGGRAVHFNRVRELFLPEQPAAIVFGHLHEPVAKGLTGSCTLIPAQRLNRDGLQSLPAGY
jgi:putative phosphoesterase